jgi:SAM-dependent methyltransferase
MEEELMNCPVCASSNVSLKWEGEMPEGRGHRIVEECQECKHCYVKDPPAVDYSARGMDYWKTNCGHQGIKSPELGPQWENFVGARLIKLAQHDMLQRCSLIEVGCSEGILVKILDKMGKDAIGYEINGAMLDSRLIKNTTLEREVERFAKCDAIFSFHTWEHVANLLSAMKAAHEMIWSGGKLFFEVPCGDDDWLNYDHVHFFRESSARKLMEVSGFMDIKVTLDTYIDCWKRTYGQIQISGKKM